MEWASVTWEHRTVAAAIGIALPSLPNICVLVQLYLPLPSQTFARGANWPLSDLILVSYVFKAWFVVQFSSLCRGFLSQGIFIFLHLISSSVPPSQQSRLTGFPEPLNSGPVWACQLPLLEVWKVCLSLLIWGWLLELVLSGPWCGSAPFCSCSVSMLTVSLETGRGLHMVHSKYLWGILVH